MVPLEVNISAMFHDTMIANGEKILSWVERGHNRSNANLILYSAKMFRKNTKNGNVFFKFFLGFSQLFRSLCFVISFYSGYCFGFKRHLKYFRWWVFFLLVNVFRHFLTFVSNIIVLLLLVFNTFANALFVGSTICSMLTFRL